MNHFSKIIAITLLTAGSSIATAQPAAYTGPSIHAATSTTAASGYSGPSTIPSMTTMQLLKNGVDDQYATLKGKLVRHVGGKRYDFADASGEMRVEISPEYFPQNQPIDANTLVEIVGKFDKEIFDKSELEVKRITVLSK